jgi:hypothetical protein
MGKGNILKMKTGEGMMKMGERMMKMDRGMVKMCHGIMKNSKLATTMGEGIGKISIG